MKSFLFCLVTVIWAAQCYCEQSLYARMLNEISRLMSVSSRIHQIDQHSDLSEFDAFSREKLLEAAEELCKSDILIDASNQLSDTNEEILPWTCINDTRLMTQGIVERRAWALKMLDAVGKPGSGLMQYDFKWWGSFEECRDSFDGPENVTQPYPAFRGQYCLAYHPFVSWAPVAELNVPVLEWGMCVPDTCTAKDVQLLLNDSVLVLFGKNISLQFRKIVCQPGEQKYGDDAIIVLSILGVFAAVLMVATIYDIIVVQLPKWRDNIFAVSVTNADEIESRITFVSTEHTLSAGQHTPLLKDRKHRSSHNHTSGIRGKLLLSFSVYTNGSMLMRTGQSSDSIPAVHGIRFFSLAWVVLGHTYWFGSSGNKNSFTFMRVLIERWTFNGVVMATLSAETFFVLSGLLVTYLTLKKMRKVNGRLNWFMYYFHRYWRLTPTYMLIIMVYVPLFKYWGDGPLWPQDGIDPNCRKNIWTNLLYINNLVRDNEQCMNWAWYLANVMQFYIVSPLIILPFFFSALFGYVTSALFLLATVISSGVISKYWNLPAGYAGMAAGMSMEDFWGKYYIKPWCRMGPYIIGMVTGYIMYRTECKVKITKALNLLGWCVAAAICLAVMYGLNGYAHGHPLNVDEAAFYNAVGRTAWGVGVAWVVFACATDHGGYVNTLLSWKGLIPLSRLTYCAYLVHPVVMALYSYSRHTPTDMSDLNLIYLFFGNLVAAYVIAFVASLAFECPMMSLEKVIFRRDKRNTNIFVQR